MTPTIVAGLILFSVVLSILAVITNPFSKLSVITLPYTARFRGGMLRVDDRSELLRVRQGLLWRVFAVLSCGMYILSTRYFHSPRSRKRTADGVISDIHQLRYNPKKLLLISGDHFSGLFVRNLGVFLYPVMDTHFGMHEQDWRRRQTTYLQTVAYALAAFRQHDTLTTTIVSTAPRSATCVNFYAYPSDTLYGILFALASLSGIETARPYAYGAQQYERHTDVATNKLIDTHHTSLADHYQRYRQQVFDETTGLIRMDVHMSGAKDITRRTCAFYDNVVFWKTSQLAMKLGIVERDEVFLRRLKRQIIDTFWLEDKGYFLEDLSDEGIAGVYYSSDWLIVLATGFLDINNDTERQYYERSVVHIQRAGIDWPFAIKYQNDTRANRQFLPVRIAVASYGGDAIWSFWGMEYIKVLLALGQVSYADYHIAKYKEAMVTYGGFPEVYDHKGRLLKTRMYHSITMTSWVIGFEQVLAIRRDLR